MVFCTVALLGCDLSEHPPIDAEQARDSAQHVTQALREAQALHANGDVSRAHQRWSTACNLFNQQLADSVSYHASSSDSLRLSYLLGRFRKEMDAKNGQPEVAMGDLESELERALAAIPDAARPE